MNEIRLVQTHADFETLVALIEEYEHSLDTELRHPHLEQEIESLRDFNTALLATVQGLAAGCVALFDLNPDAPVIKKLYVRPEYRKLGLARAMMERVLLLARTRGYSRVVLDTDRDRLAAAYRLYCAMGFTECAPYGEVDYPSPTFMELRLL